MPQVQGDPVHFELHSTDASSGVAVNIYRAGRLTAHTLASDERLIVDNLTLVTVAGGDSYAFIGADATAGAGEYILRGTFAANGGVVSRQTTTPYVGGAQGYLMYAISPAGVVDVFGSGRIVKS